MTRLGAALVLPAATINALVLLGLVAAWALWKILMGQPDRGWSRFVTEFERQQRLLGYYVEDISGVDE